MVLVFAAFNPVLIAAKFKHTQKKLKKLLQKYTKYIQGYF